MKNSVAAKLDLIERYYKDKSKKHAKQVAFIPLLFVLLESGSASGSFELFLRTRESYAERKKEALQNWEKEKQKEDALKASDSSAFAVIGKSSTLDSVDILSNRDRAISQQQLLCTH